MSFTKDLDYSKKIGDQWTLRSDIEGVVGVLSWDGDIAVKPSVMSNLILSTPVRKVDIVAGVGFGVMFGDKVFNDDHDLGGAFFVESVLGFRYRISSKSYLGYHYYHQSNGKMYANNDSVNLHQIELTWKY
jgi:hypothetical protein